MIDRLGSGCLEGVSSDYAHSEDELVEWQERRDFLRRKLAMAHDDMLVAPLPHPSPPTTATLGSTASCDRTVASPHRHSNTNRWTQHFTRDTYAHW